MGKSHDLATLKDDGGTFSGSLNVTGSNFASTTYTGTSVNPTGVYTGLTSDGGFTNNVRDSGYLQLSTNNVERMRIDASGRVTMPYQPAMFITGNWNTYQPADSATRVRFNHVKGGHNDGFNTSTHTFTAPAAGKYFMSVYALIQTGTNWEFQFYKNGSYYARCYTQGDRTTSGHVIMDMAANDYASIVCATSIYLHQTDTYSGWTIMKVS